jgi:hypothetical protein
VVDSFCEFFAFGDLRTYHGKLIQCVHVGNSQIGHSGYHFDPRAHLGSRRSCDSTSRPDQLPQKGYRVQMQSFYQNPKHLTEEGLSTLPRLHGHGLILVLFVEQLYLVVIRLIRLPDLLRTEDFLICLHRFHIVTCRGYNLIRRLSMWTNGRKEGFVEARLATRSNEIGSSLTEGQVSKFKCQQQRNHQRDYHDFVLNNQRRDLNHLIPVR